MKLLATTVSLALLSFSAFASSSCPTGFGAFKVCRSTPTAGDHQAASEFLDKIEVCSKNRETFLVLIKGSQSETTDTKVTDRPGAAATYSVNGNDVGISLATVPGRTAKLTVNFKRANLKVSSTYTCTERSSRFRQQQ
jgi:hypothetical protein